MESGREDLNQAFWFEVQFSILCMLSLSLNYVDEVCGPGSKEQMGDGAVTDDSP